MPFARLFRPGGPATDQLTQPAREAIVDVLHFAMYADAHLALSEDAVIEQVTQKFAWDPAIAFESYEAKSIGAVRQALGDAGARAALLKSVRARLPEQRHREIALHLAGKVFAADGSTVDRETAVAAELKQALLG